MDRVYESGAAATPPSPPASPSFGYPTAGNPSTPTPATKPGPYLFYQLVEEIREVITSAGLTPDHTDLTQLRQAIQGMVVGSNQAVVDDGATFEASVANGEAVRWDAGNTRYDEAIADGTTNNRVVGFADVTNSKVYLYGECALFSGLTPGARYYLDGTTPGAITATAPADAIMVGIAKSATTLFIDIDSAVADLVNQVNTWNKGQRGAVIPLTDAATIALDLSLGNNFSVILGGNRTLGNPTNVVKGQSGCITVFQDGTGGRSLAFGSEYQAAGGIASLPAMTTTIGAKNHYYYYVDDDLKVVLSLGKDIKS